MTKSIEMLQLFDEASKRDDISLIQEILSPKQNVQLGLLQNYFKFHHDQLTSVYEKKEPSGFAFCWPCDLQPRSRSLKTI